MVLRTQLRGCNGTTISQKFAYFCMVRRSFSGVGYPGFRGWTCAGSFGYTPKLPRRQLSVVRGAWRPDRNGRVPLDLSLGS